MRRMPYFLHSSFNSSQGTSEKEYQRHIVPLNSSVSIPATAASCLKFAAMWRMWEASERETIQGKVSMEIKSGSGKRGEALARPEKGKG